MAVAGVLAFAPIGEARAKHTPKYDGFQRYIMLVVALGWAVHLPNYTQPEAQARPGMHVTITLQCPEEDTLDHHAALCDVLTVEPLR
jgi:hypothetical protein